MTPDGPPFLRRLAWALSWLALAACSAGSRDATIRPGAVGHAQQHAAALGEGGGPTVAATPTPTATPAPSGSPPRNAAERRRRAQASLPPGAELVELVPVGEAARFALGLAEAPDGGSGKRRNLVLLDLASDPGIVVGEHDFGPRGPLGAEAPGGAGQAGAVDQPGGVAAVARIAAVLELASPRGEPVVLGEIRGGDGTSAACGWWLRARGTTFVCAPRAVAGSSYRAASGLLVESWQAELPVPPGFQAVSGTTGRTLELSRGGWEEIDQFRCLGWPLDRALAEAGAEELATWQRAAARRLSAAAARLAAQLDTDLAIERLREALSVDGCNPELWRRLGRLEFEAGRAARAVPPLAVAVALAPREPAALLDLADALAALNSGPPAGAQAMRAALDALDGCASTREIVERARGERRSAHPPTPEALAAACYATYLERTTADDDRAAAARRHAQQSLDELGEPAGERR